MRCAKSWLFFTTGSHGSQGPEFCTLQPLLVHEGFFVSVTALLLLPPLGATSPWAGFSVLRARMAGGRATAAAGHPF